MPTTPVPAATSAVAIARPKPRPAPVTTAVWKKSDIRHSECRGRVRSLSRPAAHGESVAPTRTRRVTWDTEADRSAHVDSPYPFRVGGFGRSAEGVAGERGDQHSWHGAQHRGRVGQ